MSSLHDDIFLRIVSHLLRRDLQNDWGYLVMRLDNQLHELLAHLLGQQNNSDVGVSDEPLQSLLDDVLSGLFFNTYLLSSTIR